MKRAEIWLAGALCLSRRWVQLPKMASAGPGKRWLHVAQAGSHHTYATTMLRSHIKFFLIPWMGISARGWTLGELVHTDSWGEDGKAQGSLGVQRAFTIAPSPAESQMPDSNTWLGGICGDINFRLSLLPSLYNPSHSLSECLSAIRPAQKNQKPSKPQSGHSRFVFVHLPALTWSEIMLYSLLCLPTAVFKVTVSPLIYHSLGWRWGWRAPHSPDALASPAPHLHHQSFIFLDHGRQQCSRGDLTPLWWHYYSHCLWGRLWLIYPVLAFVFFVVAWYLCFSVTLDQVIHPGLSLLCLFQADKLPAYSGNSCY